jgi:hypothetical protein
MGEADHRTTAGRGERIERRRLHFDGEDAGGTAQRNCRLGLAERRVRRPGRANMGRVAGLRERVAGECEEAGIGGCIGRGRKVVIARALVPHRTLDQDVIGRRPGVNDLAGRGDVHQKPAARSEQLLGHQHRERAADHTADDAAPNRVVGGAWGTHDLSSPSLGVVGTLVGVPVLQTNNPSSFIGGVEVGSRYQFGKLVVGWEGDVTWAT